MERRIDRAISGDRGAVVDFVAMRSIPVRLWVLAIVSGVLQILPFPIAGPVPVWRTAFCWIALTPLLKALTGKDASGRPLGAMRGAALGYASGIIWYLGNCYWIYATMHEYGAIAKPIAAGILVLFCLYLGLYHALFGGLVAGFRRDGRLGVQGALLLSPFAWVAAELALARITNVPWDPLGVAQVDNALLIRIVPFTGGYGLSFVIAAVNALWLARITLKERRHTRTTLTAVGVAIILLYVVFLRHLQTPVKEGTSAVATLVQENIEVGAANTGPQLTREQEIQAYTELSLYPSLNYCAGIPELASTNCIRVIPLGSEDNGARELARTNLIVWPEAPNDFYESDPLLRVGMANLARTANAPVIVGDIGIDADPAVKRGYDEYNSADFVAPDGRFVGRYDKMHLVPFGEYVPYKNLLFFAGSLLQDVGLLDHGKQRKVFATGGHSYGTFICYESVFANEIREYADLGADVLVNISDDGWYGDTSAAWEHLNMVRMRAIENHRWVLRAANTGVTAVIDPEGRVVMAAPRHVRTSLRVGFDYESDVTFYARYGDVFAYLCVLVTAGAVGMGWLRRERSAGAAEG
jgi:apolipoprotein N-acyltransferase